VNYCRRCGKPLVSTGRGEYDAVGCYCHNGERIEPPPVTRPRTAVEVVDALRAELPRDVHSGTCTYCDESMYADGVNPDTHAPDCVWVMAQNVTLES
jgi:hypothetical protein